MTDPLLGEKLRTILFAIRSDLKPEITSPNAKLRAELVDMLLSRLSVEVDDNATRGTGVAAERDWRDALEAQIEPVLNAEVKKAGSSSELEISAETFTKWLAQHEPTLVVEKVTTVPGGRSKGTILLDCFGGRQIVIRRDFAAAVIGTSVAAEFPIITAVVKAGLKAPIPLWYEASPDVIGGRFIAFERLSGRAMGTLFSSDASPEFCKDFAATLATLHQFDIDELQIADELKWGREQYPVAAMLDSFEQRYRDGMMAVPLMDDAFGWLREQLALIGNFRGLVHGDAGLHNTMGDGDRLTGLLDWEFTHAGDPAEDLAYCKFLIERIMPWDEFMAAYEAVGGARISNARINFFTVWRTLHLSILTGFAQAAYAKGVDRDLRIAAIGYNTFPKQLRDLAGDLAKAMGV